jgi:hypothetical protein
MIHQRRVCPCTWAWKDPPTPGLPVLYRQSGCRSGERWKYWNTSTPRKHGKFYERSPPEHGSLPDARSQGRAGSDHPQIEYRSLTLAAQKKTAALGLFGQ